ncbi:MAG: hypothetical protein ACJAUL_001143 [Paraglaciecola sp.]|jgi:hypothetical protein
MYSILKDEAGFRGLSLQPPPRVLNLQLISVRYSVQIMAIGIEP